MTVEAPLEPALPIVDAHHHLWDRVDDQLAELGGRRYLVDEMSGDIASGPRVVASVYVEGFQMYRVDGPLALRSLGETEFAVGQAAMSSSGRYGASRLCAAIIGFVDLRFGEEAAPILEAHVAAARGRLRGVRHAAPWDADESIVGGFFDAGPRLYLDSRFRRGFSHLERLNLRFDAWVLSPQIPELTDLARAFPNTRIVLDHMGTPLGIGSYRGREREVFSRWRRDLTDLALCPNVSVKVGGLGMPLLGLQSFRATPRAASETLAQEWRPFVESCIDIFGPERAMFESNFPIDRGCGEYSTIWNAFKRLSAHWSAADKSSLFFSTASRFYGLDLEA